MKHICTIERGPGQCKPVLIALFMLLIIGNNLVVSSATAATPPFPIDAAILRYDALESGCNLGMTTISIWIYNNGTTTINGSGYSGAVAYYTVNGILPAISEPFTAVLPPGDSVKLDFITNADLSAVNNDMHFYFISWISLPGDGDPSNDSVSKTVVSYAVPPVVYDPPTPYVTTEGSMAVLTATAPDSWDILWYTVPVGGTPVFRGNRFVTPPLSASVTYYAEGVNYHTPEAHMTCSPASFGANPAAVKIPTQGGVMLDIKPLSAPITLRALDIYPHHTGNDNVFIYFKPGTFAAGAADSTQWQVLGTYDINTSGSGQPVHLKIDPLMIPAGQKMALYLVYAQEVLPVSWADSIVDSGIMITTGAAHGSYFDPQYIHAIWNGKIWYDIAGSFCVGPRTPVPVQVNSKAAKDAAVVEILGSGISLEFPHTKSFSAKVENVGTQQFAFRVGYQIDNEPSKIFANNINLSPGASHTSGFQITFPSPGSSYRVKVFIVDSQSSPDMNPNNDTLCFTYHKPFPAHCLSFAGNAGHQDITSVAVNNVINTTPPAGRKYGLFYTNNPPAKLIAGDVCTISVTTGNVTGDTTLRNCELRIWIDWNSDGVFSQNERITTTYTPVMSTGSWSKTFTVPTTATAGLKVLRVQLIELPSGLVNPCDIYNYGETEDYLVEYHPPTNCDLGVLSADPLNSYMEAGKPIPVRVKFKNFGTATTSSPVSINLYKNNNPPVVYPFKKQLASFATDSLEIPGVIPGYGYNIYTFESHIECDVRSFNNSVTDTVFGYLHASIPFLDDFEGSQFWYNPGSLNNWQMGAPSGVTIQSAWSGNSAWKTNLSGLFSFGTPNMLYSPIFDLTPAGLTDTVVLSFSQWRDMPPGTFGMVQYSADFGTTWSNLGSENDPDGHNWYNGTVAGQGVFELQDTAWVFSSYKLPPAILNGHDSVQFRFVFDPGSDNSGDGWALDEFRLTPPVAPDDLAVIGIAYPVNDTDIASNVYVSAIIANHGLNSQAGFPVAVLINGITVLTDTVYTTLHPGDTILFAFTSPYQVPYLPYTLCVETRLAGDQYYWNDKYCKPCGVSQPRTDVGVSSLGTLANTSWMMFDWSIAICFYHPQLNPACTYPMEIELTNYGLDTITSLSLRRRWVQGTMDSTSHQTWQGTILPGASMNVLLNELFTPYIGNQTIIVYADLPGDLFPDNDSLAAIFSGITCKCNPYIEEPDDHGIKLFQNVPNPASHNTYIGFEVPSAGNYTFTIVDILGNLLMRETGYVTPGSHTISPDISSIKQGVYLYFLEFNGVRLARRMVIQR